MKPNIFIVGPSGGGKSSSLRNCDPTSTAILNSEQKALPFKGAGKFKMNVPITGYDKMQIGEQEKIVPSMKPYWDMFDRAMSNDSVKVLVNESFTSLSEHQYNASKFTHGKSYDLWADYGEGMQRVLHRSKNTDKYIVFLGIDMTIEGEGGVEERCIAVQGNMLKKKIAKEFVIVLYTDVHTDANGQIQHRFITNKIPGFENVPAKSPMGMLPPTMPNDLNLVIEYVEKYYNGEDDEVETPHKHKAVEGSEQ